MRPENWDAPTVKGCIPVFWTAAVRIKNGQLFVSCDPTRTRNLDWGMDRTVVARFSCHQPSLQCHSWPTLHRWHHSGFLRNVVGWRQAHCRTGARLRRRRGGGWGMFLDGGVAGAEPLHKGGPKARPPICKQRVTLPGLPEIGTGADRGPVATRVIREFTPILGYTPRESALYML